MNFKTDDIYRYCDIATVKGAQNRSSIIFTATTVDRAHDSYRTALWCRSIAEGGTPSRLVDPTSNPASPVLSACGNSLAFLADAPDGSRQAHRLDLDGNGADAHLLTPCGHRLKSLLEWSGPRHCLLAKAETIWTESDAHEAGTGPDDPKVVNFLPYKSDGSGIIVGKRTHLFALDIDADAWSPLTAGDFDVSDAAWSPDGKTLAFIRSAGGRQRHRTELWLADGNGANPRRLLDTFAHVRGLAWSPDGRTIAIGATRTEGDSLTELSLVNVATGEAHFHDRDLELEGSSFEWHPNGDRLATICSHRGLFSIAVVDPDAGVVARMGPRLGHVAALTQAKGKLVFIGASLRAPTELHSISWTGEGAQRLTAFNRSWFRRREQPRAIRRMFTVPDGAGGHERVDAWLLLPPNRSGPFPLLVDMHGGPRSIALIDFAAHAYWYALVSQGWAVVAPNCVGSGGYGAEFAERLRGCWGKLDLPQHLAIVTALQREGIADERVACAGKSYGGFLAAWALGQTDVFRAAVIAAPVADILSHAGTSDSGYYVTPYAMAAEIDAAPDRYRHLSPVSNLHGTQAATLFLQGDQDQRCPLGQTEQLFSHLVRCSQGPTRMVVYPGGSHSLSAKGTPGHRLDFHRRLVGWIVDHAGESCRHRTTNVGTIPDITHHNRIAVDPEEMTS